MSFFEKLLLGGVLIALVLNFNNPRAWLWLAAGVADYVITSVYYAYGLPSHSFFTLCVDALLCAGILVMYHTKGISNWESALFFVFLLSVVSSLLRIWMIVDRNVYATLLEACNWLAILIIGGTNALQLVNLGLDTWGHRSRYLHRFVSIVTADRVAPPLHFWRA